MNWLELNFSNFDRLYLYNYSLVFKLFYTLNTSYDITNHKNDLSKKQIIEIIHYQESSF